VCAAFRKRHDAEAANRIARALQGGQLRAGELAREVLDGRPDAVRAVAENLELDAGLVSLVLRFALFPCLAHFSSSLSPVRAGSAWQQGYCPVCGSWPLLGEFRGLQQTRFLRCGLCAAEWEVGRMFCPFCGTRDYSHLGYVYLEGEEAKYRAASCDACQHYLKMISTLSALTPPQLLVAEVATIPLDLAAGKRGYIAAG
jgi:FdhE protein